MKKIAVVSPNIANLGGVSRCVVVLIEALNKNKIIPDYYGVHSDKEKVKELFNRDVDYKFKRIYWPKKAILYSAWMKNIQLLFKDYDYVFDFTNTLPFGNNKGRYFSYILYPEFLSSRGKYNKGLWNIYYFPHKFIAGLRKNVFVNENINMACVSKEVSNLIDSYFNNVLPVLYPPANIDDFKNNITNKSGVVSVGGLTHEKNQLEQIGLARCFPDVSFSICGNSNRNPSYFNELLECSKDVKNLKIYPNLSFDDLKTKLIHSEVFINSGREDPFCMALIEGIAAGCIPLIHDSGGVREIVPFEELRYKDKDDATKKLRNILSMDKESKAILNIKFKKHIEIFGEKRFAKRLIEMIPNQNI